MGALPKALPGQEALGHYYLHGKTGSQCLDLCHSLYPITEGLWASSFNILQPGISVPCV